MTIRELIVTVAIVLIVFIVMFLIFYYGILGPDDDDEFDDGAEEQVKPARRIQKPAAEVNPYAHEAAYVEQWDKPAPAVEIPKDPFDAADAKLRARYPRLYSDTWYEETVREFSQWAVDMRVRHGLAA